MLLDSFAGLAKDETPFRDTYVKLLSLVERYKDLPAIDPALIARDLPLLDAFDVADALSTAVKRGVLRVRYTVLTPDGVVASDNFASPAQIPASLTDRFEEPYETSRYPLVTVYEPVEHATSIPAERNR